MHDNEDVSSPTRSDDDDEQEWFGDVDKSITPYIGQRFNNVDEAYEFYCSYAFACGFDVRRSTSRKWRDKTWKSKLYVCNREGVHTPNEVKEEEECEKVDIASSPKRKCRTRRVRCKANFRIHVRGNDIVVDTFHEGHSHELVSLKDREFQKSSRNLSHYHKEMIVWNSRLSIGATKTYNMCKEQVNGFVNIGASLNDFKNFSRNVKCFINGRDGQFFIDHFKSMVENRDGFFFDYEVDEDNSLKRAIWADRIARRNYGVFGDGVSFDPTYATNKYSMVFTPFTGVDHHGKSVTFCGALIAQEDHESFNWVFSRFLRAMDGKEPEYIITDQDPGIIKSVEQTFRRSRHRFCMWHIMNKVPAKYGSTREDYKTFLKKMNDIVWDEDIDASEFDSRWDEIMSEHDTGVNKVWFEETFNIRRQWIMAHCKDLRMGRVMRTTQRSESENSFFKRFESKSGTLVEFWMRFESAMDQQRHTQKKLDNDSHHSDHQKISHLDIERHGAKIYTHEMFEVFQEEIKYSMNSCSVKGFWDRGEFEVTNVRDSIRDKTVKVQFKPDTFEASCSCRMFKTRGILCRHIIWVYSGHGVKKIPDLYVLKRWTKDAVRDSDETNIIDGKHIELTKLWSEVHQTIGMLRGQDKGEAAKLCSLIREFRLGMAPLCEPLTKQQEIEGILGCKPTPDVQIRPPKQANNKGTGKRLVSSRTTAIKKAAKPKRLCGYCKEMANHDRRNCPKALRKDHPPDSGDDDEDGLVGLSDG